MPQKVIFCHIPKTAGQSINILLKYGFRKRLFFPGKTDSQLALYSADDMLRYGVFSGHFSTGPLEILRDSFFFSIIRDPVERLLSVYRYQREVGNRLSASESSRVGYRSSVAASYMRLDEFLSASEPGLKYFLTSQLDNFYVYYFGTRRINGHMLVGGDARVSKDKMLQNAVENIAGNMHIFFTDRLDQLTQALRTQEDFEEYSVPRVNVSGTAFTKESVRAFVEENSANASLSFELIAQMTSHDQKLYDMLRGVENG